MRGGSRPDLHFGYCRHRASLIKRRRATEKDYRCHSVVLAYPSPERQVSQRAAGLHMSLPSPRPREVLGFLKSINSRPPFLIYITFFQTCSRRPTIGAETSHIHEMDEACPDALMTKKDIRPLPCTIFHLPLSAPSSPGPTSFWSATSKSTPTIGAYSKSPIDCTPACANPARAAS